jgi:hypothetical protein
MSTWLYQLNQREWLPGVFRYEVRENQRWRWGYGKIIGDATPTAGDTLVFFYARTGGGDPGFYAWAIVDRCDEENELLYFIPMPPTDYLKMNPWWNEEAELIADDIRGKMKQATLFLIPEEKLSTIRRGITNWLFPGRERAPYPKAPEPTV